MLRSVCFVILSSDVAYFLLTSVHYAIGLTSKRPKSYIILTVGRTLVQPVCFAVVALRYTQSITGYMPHSMRSAVTSSLSVIRRLMMNC